MSRYQELFNHMSQEHGLSLLESEMDEIVRISAKLNAPPECVIPSVGMDRICFKCGVHISEHAKPKFNEPSANPKQ